MPHPSRSSRALARLALGLAIGPCLSGCGAGDEDERLNVLMVVIDTARADKFGSYGHSGGLTPRMDELAAQGATFERAVAHAPWTLPSTASLLSSLHPQEHGAGGFLDLEKLERGDSSGIGFRPLPDSVQTVTESFRASGWRTGAIVNVDFLDEGFGLTQGIDDLDARWYESNQEVRSATQTTDKALDWLDDHADEPFFLLTHYFDAHDPYLWHGPHPGLDPENRKHRYLSELMFLDHWVGKLIAALPDGGRDTGIFVFAATSHVTAPLATAPHGSAANTGPATGVDASLPKTRANSVRPPTSMPAYRAAPCVKRTSSR